MKIAILGWGSLIWSPQTLNYNTTFGWQTNGPILPIEFARISKDGRLTLVLTPNGTNTQTLYAISSYNTIEEAILNLAIREGSGRMSIGFYEKSNNQFSPINFKYKKNIEDWLEVNNDIDAVIWTNLPEKWVKETSVKIKKYIEPNERIEYLKDLKGNKRAIAEEYIRKTPPQIKTKYRALIEKELNWHPIVP